MWATSARFVVNSLPRVRNPDTWKSVIQRLTDNVSNVSICERGGRLPGLQPESSWILFKKKT